MLGSHSKSLKQLERRDRWLQQEEKASERMKDNKCLKCLLVSGSCLTHLSALDILDALHHRQRTAEQGVGKVRSGGCGEEGRYVMSLAKDCHGFDGGVRRAKG